MKQLSKLTTVLVGYGSFSKNSASLKILQDIPHLNRLIIEIDFVDDEDDEHYIENLKTLAELKISSISSTKIQNLENLTTLEMDRPEKAYKLCNLPKLKKVKINHMNWKQDEGFFKSNKSVLSEIETLSLGDIDSDLAPSFFNYFLNLKEISFGNINARLTLPKLPNWKYIFKGKINVPVNYC